MKISDDTKLKLAVVAVAVAALWYAKKNFSAAGVGAAVGNAVGNAAGGLITGIGAAVGVPATDAQKCAAAKASGDVWAMSLYCPAGDFLSSSAGMASDAVTHAIDQGAYWFNALPSTGQALAAGTPGTSASDPNYLVPAFGGT